MKAHFCIYLHKLLIIISSPSSLSSYIARANSHFCAHIHISVFHIHSFLSPPKTKILSLPFKRSEFLPLFSSSCSFFFTLSVSISRTQNQLDPLISNIGQPSTSNRCSSDYVPQINHIAPRGSRPQFYDFKSRAAPTKTTQTDLIMNFSGRLASSFSLSLSLFYS
jgi:hypothetical protein